jgi:lysophospholipase L1-like esterase
MQKIVCHGDSLTEAADIGKPFTWPALVENRLGTTFHNTGIGGDTTGGMLSRFYPDVVQQRPDAVIIMGGTNDLWWGLDLKTIQANLFAMASQASFHGIAPVLGLPLPIDLETVRAQDMLPPAGGFEKIDRRLQEMASAIEDSALKNDVPTIDFHSRFRGQGQGARKELFLEDGLHPNKAGQQVMARAVLEVFQRHFLLAGGG